MLDLYSRATVGWAASATIDTELVCTALCRAFEGWAVRGEGIFYPERGSQCTSAAMQISISEHEGSILPSHVISFYENAAAESFSI
jgi:transposase InsO family protein